MKIINLEIYKIRLINNVPVIVPAPTKLTIVKGNMAL